jgi:hypothetical protein
MERPREQPRLNRRQLLRGAGLGAAALAVGGALPAGALPRTRQLLGGGATREALRLARVWPGSPAQWAALAAFDDTHRVFDDGAVELLLWPGDLARLDGLGIRYRITVDDLVARDAALRADPTTTTTVSAPGQVDEYRRLGTVASADPATYNGALRYLADTYPDQVALFSLPEPSLDGRTIYGIEICTDVGRRDGRPVFYMDGLHHAREWPAGEFTIMFAFDLLTSYASDARVRAIMDNVRTVLVPVQNPDGFNWSREALIDNSATDNPVTGHAYWRKNRRNDGHVLDALIDGYGAYGIDPNRNYGLQWGGDGSSGSQSSQTYRGVAPFSEPEVRNIRHLLASIHAITLNSNHTSGRLILRPPGAKFFGTTPDDALMKDLGDAMAAFNGYRSQYSWQLYDTSGTTMDWGYGAHGSLSYTFEHATAFHPAYGSYIPGAYTDGGNRDAFLLLAEAAGDPANYCTLTGTVVDAEGRPVPAEVRVSKAFDIPLWRDGDGSNPTGLEAIAEVVDTAMDAPEGTFRFCVNPSRRPYEAGDGVAYTVTATADGRTASTQVRISRGEVVDLGMLTVA